MGSFSRTVNSVLARVGLHLSRDSSFRGLQDEFERQRKQLSEVLADQGKSKQEENRLLQLSKQRWAADEPDEGLTWGVPMTGDAFVQFLVEHVRLDESSFIVEVGPGYGRILKALLKAGLPFHRYLGLELSKARVQRLRDQFRDRRIDFVQADVLGGNIELNGVADLTISSAVFEHLYPDCGAALQTIAGFTRPGGSVVVDFIWRPESPDSSERWFDHETYIRVYSLAELKALFQERGFNISETSRISFGPDMDNREIMRTVVWGTAGDTESHRPPSPQARVQIPPFVDFVNRAPAAGDEQSHEPPLKSEFRSPFGGLWTDLNRADAVLSGKVAIGSLLPSDAAIVDAWIRDGYVILPGAISPAMIDAALADFEAAYDGKFDRKMTFWEGDDLHCDPASREHLRKKDAKLLDLHHVSDAIQAIVFAEPIQHFLEILFERPALAFQSLGFYYGTQQPTHQDCAFVRVNSPLEFVASWIALEDITPGSGELEYYPGSHRLPHYFFGGRYLWFKGDEPQAYQFFEHLRASAERANLSKKRFIAKKGDVLIWSASLMHGGSPVENVQLTRKSLVSHYCPADLQPMFAYGSGRLKQKSVHGQYIMAEH